MRPGEIFLASFPFGDIAGMKLRPVLVLAGPIGPIPEVLVAYISSVLPTALMPSDLVLDPAQAEFRSTNLKTASVLRLHKLATICVADGLRTSKISVSRPGNIAETEIFDVRNPSATQTDQVVMPLEFGIEARRGP